MTLTGGAVAGLLVVGHSGFAAGWYALSFLGIVLAHVSNNLVNDLFGTDTGLAYTRAGALLVGSLLVAAILAIGPAWLH